MKNRHILYLSFFIVWTTRGISQPWLDSVRTIYASSYRLHHTTFMKRIVSYYGGERSTLLVVEDSEAVSLFKVASVSSYNVNIPSFHTILKRPASIGNIQFIGLYSDQDSLQHQFLFWEEGSGSEQRILYTLDVPDSTWETPRYISPSRYRRQELIGSQTNRSTSPDNAHLRLLGMNRTHSL